MIKMSGPISYRNPKSGGHKLLEAWWVQTPFTGQACEIKLTIRLDDDGKLWIAPGYLWDGASGLTWDTDNCRRAALVHDVFYQFMRERKMSPQMRRGVDRFFRNMLEQDGMIGPRRWTWYWTLRLFGKSAAAPRKPGVTNPTQTKHTAP